MAGSGKALLIVGIGAVTLVVATVAITIAVIGRGTSNSGGQKGTNVATNASDDKSAPGESSPSKSTSPPDTVGNTAPKQAPPKNSDRRSKEASDAFAKGIAYRENKETEKAIACFDEVIRLNPDDAEAYLNRALANFDPRNPNLLHLRLSRVPNWPAIRTPRDKKISLDAVRRAVTDVGRAIRIDPDYAQAFYVRGLIYTQYPLVRESGEYPEHQFTEAIRLSPDFVEAHYARGVIYYNDHEQYKAAGDFEEVVRLLPTHPEAHFNLGLALGTESKQCIDAFSEAIRLNPQFADAYVCRGLGYMHAKKDPDMAIADYTKAIEVDPNNAEAFHFRGKAHGGTGNLKKAIADLTEAIRLAPYDSAAYSARSLCYNEAGEREKGKADDEKYGFLSGKLSSVEVLLTSSEAIREDANDVESLKKRGEAYTKLCGFKEAIADYSEAIRISPRDGIAYSGRGNAYKEMGAFGQAIADYTRAIEIEPSNYHYYSARSLAYRDAGDRKRGEADSDTALELYQKQPNRNRKSAGSGIGSSIGPPPEK